MYLAFDGSLRIDLGQSGSDRIQILAQSQSKGPQRRTAQVLRSLEPGVQVLSTSGPDHLAKSLHELIDWA